MARNKDLGTPKCCAEYRAWMAVYLKRVISKTSLKEAFNKQFPDNKLDNSFFYHLGQVRKCKDETRSQLLDLAKRLPWYKDSPQEGETGYKAMKKLERNQEARERWR